MFFLESAHYALGFIELFFSEYLTICSIKLFRLFVLAKSFNWKKSLYKTSNIYR